MKTESQNAKKLHINRKFNYDRVKEYHQKYINQETGLIFDHISENRNCPVCNLSNSRTIFNKSGGTYVCCENCNMVYLNPILNEAELKNYYIHLNTGQGEIVENESSFYREIYEFGLQKIEEVSNGNLILDIGCSTGFFLDIAKKDQWITYGIELGVLEAQRAIEKGHHIFSSLITDLNTELVFDAITMWDVFEHIPNGDNTLQAIRNFLAPNGILFLQIPNSGSLAARILQEKCNMFDGIEHVNLYNPETIQVMAKKNGFEIIKIGTVISELSVLKNYLSYDNPYFGSQAGTDFLGLLSPEIIHKELLGYKMQVLLKKVQ